MAIAMPFSSLLLALENLFLFCALPSPGSATMVKELRIPTKINPSLNPTRGLLRIPSIMVVGSSQILSFRVRLCLLLETLVRVFNPCIYFHMLPGFLEILNGLACWLHGFWDFRAGYMWDY